MRIKFRDFASRVTQQPTVIETWAILQNQNESLNINFVLYAIWFAIARQGRLRRTEFLKLFEAAQSWHDRILTALNILLKKSQHLLKGNGEHLLLNIEEDIQFAYSVEQSLLADAIMPTTPLQRNETQQLADASFNLAQYYKLIQARLDVQTRDMLISLLKIIFPTQSHFEIGNHLGYAINHAKISQKPGFQMVFKNLS